MSNAKENLTKIRNERRDVPTCFDCVNFRSGTCAFRLGSPDYPTASVDANSISCSEFNVPSTRVEREAQPVFSGLPEAVFYEGTKGSTNRTVLDMSVMSVDAMHRLGMIDEQYPVLAVTVQHNGEHVVFYMPNTRTVTIDRHKIAANRYDVVNLFTKVSERGKVDLTHWRRVQFES